MKHLFTSLLLASLSITSVAYGKTINLYSEPKTDSKVAGNVNTETGVTIVYTPKSSEWIKVANPTNGDVGWVKSSELGGNNFNMRVITSENGPHSYKVYQFGSGSSQYNQQQIEKEMKQFERQQQMMYQHMQNMLSDMSNMFHYPGPMFLPVVVIPADQKTQKTASSKAVQTAQKTQTKPTESVQKNVPAS